MTKTTKFKGVCGELRKPHSLYPTRLRACKVNFFKYTERRFNNLLRNNRGWCEWGEAPLVPSIIGILAPLPLPPLKSAAAGPPRTAIAEAPARSAASIPAPTSDHD